MFQRVPALSVFFGLLFSACATADPIRVELRASDGRWQLTRAGVPYRIKGAGGHQYLDVLAAHGGNSIRTWGVDERTQALLDEAHSHGISVTVGIWLGHERHGFDYSDSQQLADQLEHVREAVLAYRDHPAVLMWGVGNEMEGYQTGDDPRIWNHVEACAALIQSLDPNHPTMTVIAEIGGGRIQAINEYCPSIDIIGVNSYGGASTLPERYQASGSAKPYIVTEFGPLGPWELPSTDFGAAPEPTSTQKAETYRASYEAMMADRGRCLGSYAFLWGEKVEATPTWFGMFLTDGSKVNAVDVMAELWSGQAPDDLCPAIEPLVLEGAARVTAGATVRVSLSAVDPEGGTLSAEWLLMGDAMNYLTGGDVIETPPSYPDHIESSDLSGCEFVVPDEPGVYRLYVVVRDAAGNAATANTAVYVMANEPVVEEGNGVLPGVVYAEATDALLWHPSGYMGSHGAIQMQPDHRDQPRSGETCMRVSYSIAGEWGGVAWQSPANDWGDLDGGFNLTGATVLEFWARGQRGGEVVNFGFGLLGADKAYPDTTRGELTNLQLTDQWQRYEIVIPQGADLRRIKTGFYWTLAGQGQPVTFYLDDIAFRAQSSGE